MEHCQTSSYINERINEEMVEDAKGQCNKNIVLRNSAVDKDQVADTLCGFSPPPSAAAATVLVLLYLRLRLHSPSIRGRTSRTVRSVRRP